MNYKEQKAETEILSTDDQKVHEMCSSLKKIDAPNDFDFKLKARIANSNAGDFQPRFGFAVRYALPVMAMIFVLGFLAYNSGMLSSSKENSMIAESSATENPALPQNNLVTNYTVQNPPKPRTGNSAIPTPQQNLPKISEKEIADKNPQNSKKVTRQNEKDFINNSKDSALKGITPIQPNFNSNIKSQKPSNIEKLNPMPVKEILAQFGINAVFENSKWKVKSVAANTIAESSGIQQYDVIEAIDNQTISAETVFNKTFNGKTLTILRDAKKLEIKLQNK